MDTRLFIFVEGLDDARFFRSIIVPRIQKRYRSVEIIMYAGMKNEKFDAFCRSIRMLGHEYLVLADIDQASTVTAKKRILKKRYHEPERERMFIVIREIESWYLAGIGPEDLERLGLPDLATTNEITKEDFNRLMPVMFRSRIAFLLDLVRCYSIMIGRAKNRSFDFFALSLQLSS